MHPLIHLLYRNWLRFTRKLTRHTILYYCKSKCVIFTHLTETFYTFFTVLCSRHLPHLNVLNYTLTRLKVLNDVI